MRPVRYTANAAGFSQPVMVNYMQPNFNVAVGVMPGTGATVSCSAQITMDDQSVDRQVTFTQAGTTVTIKDGVQPFGMGSSSLPSQLNPHGLTTGDTITLKATNAGIDGNYAVTVVDASTYTITVTPSQTIAAGEGKVIPQRWVTSTAVPLATAARLFANIEQPFTALRFVIATLTGGSVDFIVLQGQD